MLDCTHVAQNPPWQLVDFCGDLLSYLRRWPLSDTNVNKAIIYYANFLVADKLLQY